MSSVSPTRDWGWRWERSAAFDDRAVTAAWQLLPERRFERWLPSLPRAVACQCHGQPGQPKQRAEPISPVMALGDAHPRLPLAKLVNVGLGISA